MRKSLLHRITARLRKNSIYARLLAISGRPLTEKKWIFIIGCYNSGTTLLDQILASHDLISGLPDEGVMLTNQLKRPEDLGWRRMWWKCEDQLAVAGENPAQIAITIQRHWSNFYDTKKPYVLEKSIANTCRISFFEQHFNSPYFIHIVRNGYAVAEGIHRKATIMDENPLRPLGHYPMEYCIRQWMRSLQVIERDVSGLKNFLQIRYEDLAECPGDTLKNVLTFLNLPPINKDLHNQRFSIHRNFSTIKNMNDDSIARLTEKDIAQINAIAGDTLIRYGYPILSK
jgi:hypothetical protein